MSPGGPGATLIVPDRPGPSVPRRAARAARPQARRSLGPTSHDPRHGGAMSPRRVRRPVPHRRPLPRPLPRRRPRPPGGPSAGAETTAPGRVRVRWATLAAVVLVAGLLVLPGPGSTTTAAAPGRAVGGAPPAAPPVPRDALDAVARAAGLDAGGSDADAGGTYRLPVTGGVLRARFDPPAQRWSAGHRGVDLEAAPGTAVVAPAAGTVVVAGPVVDRHVVTVLHDDGRRSSLEPVVAGAAVGTRVEAGAPVGTVEPPPAATHCAPRCLHWGVRQGERYVDPLGLLRGAGPVVLLPGAGRDAA